MTNTNRQPAGVPTGGQFAPEQRPEATGVELGQPDPQAEANAPYPSRGLTVDDHAFLTSVENNPTPWGYADDVRLAAPGIAVVATPGHGGYKLAVDRNAQVHPAWRNRNGWYEEDCEWVAVAATFPELHHFRDINARVAGSADGLPYTERVARDYYPDAYEQVTGRSVQPGQSHRRDEQLFRAEHAQDPVVVSASMAHDAGVDPALLDGRTDMVRVVTTRGGTRSANSEHEVYLVSQAEYEQPHQFGFVVDPQRHQRLDD